MSSAKAALESDTKVLAYEAGRKYGVRVNTISAGPLGSRAAKAIGFIDDMIRWVGWLAGWLCLACVFGCLFAGCWSGKEVAAWSGHGAHASGAAVGRP